ncbi:MAG: hypothetical protein U0232_12545 [Thermomicrobiales bacterium]
MGSNDLAWSGETWRLPLWLWLGLGAMAVGTLHILLDASVGLFPARGRLAPAVAAALLLIALVHAWWGVSLAAGRAARPAGWRAWHDPGAWLDDADQRLPDRLLPAILLRAAPLTDVAHLGSLALGPAAAAAGDLGAVAAAGAGGLGPPRRRPGARGGDDRGAVQGGRALLRAVRVGGPRCLRSATSAGA